VGKATEGFSLCAVDQQAARKDFLARLNHGVTSDRIA
jgi:hypothetical protein